MTQSLLDRINAIQESKEQKESTSATQLITIESSNALDLFTDEDKLKELLFLAVQKTRTLVPDVFTEKGRKDIASMAYSVARTKTYLDSIGKELVSHYKEVPKKIDSVRKFARDSLDSLRDEVRNPLDDWENEQARLKLIEEIADCHSIALEMNRVWIEAKEQQRHREEVERLQREEDIRASAVRDAELRLKIEREKLEEKHRLDLVRAEENRIKAIEQAEIAKAEAINAERRRAEQQQKIIEDKKRLDEENRIKAEQYKENERVKLMNDIKHREFIQMALINDLVLCSQISTVDAKSIITAIEKGLIPYLSINY
jgi:hypothetical protein